MKVIISWPLLQAELCNLGNNGEKKVLFQLEYDCEMNEASLWAKRKNKNFTYIMKSYS